MGALAGGAPGFHHHVVGLGAAFGGPGGGQVRQLQQLVPQTALQGLLLLLQARHLLLDAVSLLPQLGHLGTIGTGTGLDPLPHLTADAVALGLQAAALLLQIPFLAGDLLKPGEVDLQAPAAELPADQLRVIAQQALVQHGGKAAWRQPRGR